MEVEDVNLSKPTFIAVKPVLGVPKYKPVADVSSSSFVPKDTVFKLFKNDMRGVKKEIPPTPNILVQIFFSTEHVDYLVDCSNKYCDLRRQDFPDLSIWKHKRSSAEITTSYMYHFIVILYYIGLIKLPCKYDYWGTAL